MSYQVQVTPGEKGIVTYQDGSHRLLVAPTLGPLGSHFPVSVCSVPGTGVWVPEAE